LNTRRSQFGSAKAVRSIHDATGEVALRIDLDELFARIHEVDVVNARALSSAVVRVKLDRAVVDPSDLEVRDQKVVRATYPDPVGRIPLGRHARSQQHHIVAVVRGAADGHAVHELMKVERASAAGEVEVPGWMTMVWPAVMFATARWRSGSVDTVTTFPLGAGRGGAWQGAIGEAGAATSAWIVMRPTVTTP